MQNHKPQDLPSPSTLEFHASTTAVAPQAEEEPATDADEPPDERPLGLSPASKRFQKSTVRRVPKCYPSLLTKALQSHSEDDSFDGPTGPGRSYRRRRSFASNISVASTADLSCDTALTTPARTSSPSPRLPQEAFATPVAGLDPVKALTPTEQAHGNGEKKRCISFACAAAPERRGSDAVASKAIPTIVAPKRPCIKFACVDGKPGAPQQAAPKPRASGSSAALSATPRKYRSPSTNSRSNRSVTPKRSSNSNATVRFRNFLSADPNDLRDEASRFHEFATDEVREDDWIRQDLVNSQRRLTIEDTLQMELAISRLGKEAEEEAEQEEAGLVGDADDLDDNEDEDEDEDDDDAGDDEEGEDYDDAWAGNDGSDYESSEGYRTDEEIGFAESDDDDDDGLVLWSASSHSAASKIAINSFQRRVSAGDLSDSSAFSPGHTVSARPKIARLSPRTAFRPATPDLPDSTDFVCGTLDEDRPLEEAYISCINARKQEKLRLIPQDIDPSFPTSDPEDEDDESFRPLHRNSEEHVWLHGEIEGLDMDEDPVDRRKKKVESPKRLHSPPPRARGRSPPPRRLFDRQSPTRRLRSPPPPQSTASPHASPIHGGQRVTFKALAFRPGLTHTKSLPRAPALMGHLKPSHQRKKPAATAVKEQHVRGAIDIVKGLEQRRQRRREKFKEKQCNRARKGLAQERRPQPGKGAERMRELGLLMAGKLGPGNYVLSV